MLGVGVMVADRPRPPDARVKRDEDLLRKADELVDLAKEVRDDMRRVTTLYEERQYGVNPEKRPDVQ